MMLFSTVLTGTVASVAVLSSSATQSSGVAFDRDQAFYAAEAGVQRAVWNINHNGSPSTWLASLPLTETLANGSSYKISAGTINWPTAPVSFQCVGTSKDSAVTSQASVTIAQSTNTGAGFSPGFAMSGSDTFAGTLNIAGTFESTGSFTAGGTVKLTNVAGQPNASLEAMGSYTGSATFSVPGNMLFNSGILSSGSVTVGGNVQSGAAVTHSGTWHVTGTTTANKSPSLAFTTPTVDTSGLIAQKYGSTQVITGSGTALSSLTLNFANNPVIEINGNLVTNSSTVITIIPPTSGSGTLIVNGNMNCSTTLGSSSAPVAMNIVTTGNITQSGTQYITGSVCCGGTLTVSGTYNVNGCVVTQKGIAGSGTMTMGYVTPPSFVDWADSGGGVGSTSNSVVTVSNFMGPMY